MTKVYITAVQYAASTASMYYIPQNIYGITENFDAYFPITPVIKNTLKAGDDVKVIAVVMEGKTTESNMEKLYADMERVNVPKEAVVAINMKQDQSVDNMQYLYKELIKAIPDDCHIYGCVTYGSKPISYTMASAMTYIEDYKTDVLVKGMIYGELVWDTAVKDDRGRLITADAKLYDLNALYHAGSLVHRMAAGDRKLANRMLDIMMPGIE